MRKLSSLFFFFFFLIHSSLFPDIENTTVEKAKHLAKEFLTSNQIPGIAVAIIWYSQESKEIQYKTFTFGELSKSSKIDVNNYAEFRLGSISEIFTATLLASYVQKGKIGLNDPADKYLSKNMKLPNFKGKAITIKDLATHTSGLPNISYDAINKNICSLSGMQRFLMRFQLPFSPGMEFRYSNVGYALLSNILSRVSGMAFSDLLEKNLLSNLSLKDTVFNLSKDQKARLAIGSGKDEHLITLKREKLFSLFLGSGGLYSTLNDLLKVLIFQLGGGRSSLKDILPVMQKPYFFNCEKEGPPKMALGWEIYDYHGSDLYQKQGNIFGYRSLLKFLPNKQLGVAILSNSDHSLSSLSDRFLELIEGA